MDEQTKKRIEDATEKRTLEVVSAARVSIEQAFINCESERRFAESLAARLPEGTPLRQHYEQMSAERSARVGQLLIELGALNAELTERQAKAPPAAPEPSLDRLVNGPAPEAEPKGEVDSEKLKAAAARAAKATHTHKEKR